MVPRLFRKRRIGPDPHGRDVSARILLVIVVLSFRQGFCLACAAVLTGPALAFPWI